MLYGEFCDRTLEFHGQQAIPPQNFGTDNETKYQRQMRRFFEFCHEAVLSRMNEPWMQRRFQLPLTAGVAEYNLDDTAAVENLVPFSIILLGADSPGRMKAYPGGYNAWRRIYTDDSLVSTAQPCWWFELPTDSASAVRTKRVRFDPIPDTAYICEYQCKINVPTPQNREDILVFPDDYIFALQAAAGTLLEWSLKGGVTDGTIYELAKQAVDSVKQWSTGPSERKPGVRMDVRIAGRTPRRGYGTNTVGRQGWY